MRDWNADRALHRSAELCLTADAPLYPTGPLPVEYLPLNAQTLHSGDHFGPLAFRIGFSSHSKHLGYLGVADSGGELLTPFELWPFARVVSQWRFGRINEVISVEAKRLVHRDASWEDEFLGETVAERVVTQRGICFARFISRTHTTDKRLVMESEDTILLANSCDAASLHEAVKKTARSDVGMHFSGSTEPLDSWTLEMRFAWPENLWQNNVHTRSYATSLGFEHPLVEGPAVADRVWRHVRNRIDPHPTLPMLIHWRYRGPLYEGTKVDLFETIATASHFEFAVCERAANHHESRRVLMEIEISNA